MDHENPIQGVTVRLSDHNSDTQDGKDSGAISSTSSDPNATESLSVIKRSLLCLEPGQWFNDNLIEFGMRLYFDETRLSRPEVERDTFFFNSFLNEKLKAVGILGLKHLPEDLAAWTKGTDLMQKKYIITPIHERNHWSRMHVVPTTFRKQPRVRTGKRANDVTKSIPSGGELTNLELLCLFLILPELDLKERDIRGLRCHLVEVPRQPNTYDCGVYLLHFVKTFMRDPEGACRAMEHSAIAQLRSELRIRFLDFIKQDSADVSDTSEEL
ncbi:cysteine proteinase [Dentipellis sp. KUC8613]|nr:cysteine proteinase [Dentipellis sp. KUC8613]